MMNDPFTTEGDRACNWLVLDKATCESLGLTEDNMENRSKIRNAFRFIIRKRYVSNHGHVVSSTTSV